MMINNIASSQLNIASDKQKNKITAVGQMNVITNENAGELNGQGYSGTSQNDLIEEYFAVGRQI